MDTSNDPLRISRDNPYLESYDLTNCDQEPIHRIQTIQSFACVLAVDPQSWTIQQCSDNAASFVGLSPNEVVGSPVSAILPENLLASLSTALKQEDFSELNPSSLPISPDVPKPRQATFMWNGSSLLLQIEFSAPSERDWSLLQTIDHAIQQIQQQSIPEVLFHQLTSEVQKITGYDRVMLYRFDREYNGEVIAEIHAPDQEAFLGLRYPASDIPRQARNLFLNNRVRMIADVEDELSMLYPPLNPKSGTALDLTPCSARGVSPIHLEYLRNMGVRASLSVAVVEDGKLWGLIACHHRQPKILSYRTRSLLQFMGQILSGHLSLSRANLFRETLLKKNLVHARLFEFMNQDRDLISGLTRHDPNLLDYVKGAGLGILFEDRCTLLGQAPSEEAVRELAKWLLATQRTPVVATHELGRLWPEAREWMPEYAGLLALNVSEDPAEFICWFRHSQKTEVHWGGNPNKSVLQQEAGKRLSPRKSFEKWQQIVEGESLPWEQYEIEAVVQLRNDIKEIILKRFQELKQLNQDLQSAYQELESFSYTVSHDLRSPLRGIEGFANILIEDYLDKLDSYGMEVVQTIITNVAKMNAFINDTLALSKLANVHLSYQVVEVREMVEELVETYRKIFEVEVELTIIGEIPKVHGDRHLLYQLFSNLIENAIKYSQPKGKVLLTFHCDSQGADWVFSLTDNGIGFNPEYKEKIFEVFSRLVDEEAFPGTGIGLSIVKRIVERHHGRIDVESTPGEGSRFFVYFPKKQPNFP